MESIASNKSAPSKPIGESDNTQHQPIVRISQKSLDHCLAGNSIDIYQVGECVSSCTIPLYLHPAEEGKEPTVPKNSQGWKGMSASDAYWLVQRHADGWGDVSLMLNEWLNANSRPAKIPTDKEIFEVIKEWGKKWAKK